MRLKSKKTLACLAFLFFMFGEKGTVNAMSKVRGCDCINDLDENFDRESEEFSLLDSLISNSYSKGILSGYSKKYSNATNEEIITGKIKLVPIEEKYRDDWKRIMDCSDEKGKGYLQWWTKSENLNNNYMEDSFDSYVNAMRKPGRLNKFLPDKLTFMIEFSEVEFPVSIEDIGNAKFKEPKIAGYITISCGRENEETFVKRGNYTLSYVVDRNFQGKGIATKSLEMITSFGSELYSNGLYPFKSFVMYIACDNIASEKVALKNEFRDMGSVPIERTNNLVSHMWYKEDKSNRFLNLLNSPVGIFNEQLLKESVLLCPKNENFEVVDFYDFTDKSEKFENMEGFEKIQSQIDALTVKDGDTDMDLVYHMWHSEWPVAWMKNGKLYSAIPENLSAENIYEISHLIHFDDPICSECD